MSDIVAVLSREHCSTNNLLDLHFVEIGILEKISINKIFYFRVGCVDYACKTLIYFTPMILEGMLLHVLIPKIEEEHPNALFFASERTMTNIMYTAREIQSDNRVLTFALALGNPKEPLPSSALENLYR